MYFKKSNTGCIGKRGKCNIFGTNGCNKTSYGNNCMCKIGYKDDKCGTCDDFFYPFTGSNGKMDNNGNGVSCIGTLISDKHLNNSQMDNSKKLFFSRM